MQTTDKRVFVTTLSKHQKDLTSDSRTQQPIADVVFSKTLSVTNFLNEKMTAYRQTVSWRAMLLADRLFLLSICSALSCLFSKADSILLSEN